MSRFPLGLLPFVLCSLAAASGTISERVDTKTLERELTERARAIPEFRRLAEEAQSRGIRVWIFGGSAASLAHYAKWKILLSGGDSRFAPSRFDDDLTSIFRSTQDIDIVVDKGAREAGELQRWLVREFPYFQGNKDQWEVRSLVEPSGNNGALLGDFDFANQHTDSQSTGLIELTQGTGPRVRDVREWDDTKDTAFLRDVAAGEISYRFSPTHGATSRARAGMNPPILSVVRYLTKAFQFGLTMKPEDMRILSSIIRDFNPMAPLHPYVHKWLQKNGAKLLLHAIDLPQAIDTLDALGLRAKLVALPTVPDERGASFWLAKEALRDRDDRANRLGTGPAGRTAGELGITEVAHATKDFETWESIRKSPFGVPLFFISRQNAEGEAALLGDGLYTELGSEGWTARGGFSIRMKVDPAAREGIDFKQVRVLDYDNPQGFRDWVLWYTRDKLEVIPESLDIDPAEALQFIVDPANARELGKKELLKKRIERRFLEAAQRPYIEKLIEERLKNRDLHKELGVWALKAPAFRNHAARFDHWVELVAGGGKVNYELFQNVMGDADIRKLPKWGDWMVLAVKSGDRTDEALDLLDPEASWDHPDWGRIVQAVFEGRNPHGFHALYYRTLALPRAVREPGWAEWVATGIKELPMRDVDIAQKVLATPEAVAHEKWLDLVRLIIASAAKRKETRLVHWIATAIEVAIEEKNPAWTQAVVAIAEAFPDSKYPGKYLSDPQLLRTAAERRGWIALVEKALTDKKGSAVSALLANKGWKTHRAEWEPLVERFVGEMPSWDVESLLKQESLRGEKKWLHWVETLSYNEGGDFTALLLLLDPHAMKLSGWNETVSELVGRIKYCYGAERTLREFADEHGGEVPESLEWAKAVEKKRATEACGARVARVGRKKRD